MLWCCATLGAINYWVKWHKRHRNFRVLLWHGWSPVSSMVENFHGAVLATWSKLFAKNWKVSVFLTTHQALILPPSPPFLSADDGPVTLRSDSRPCPLKRRSTLIGAVILRSDPRAELEPLVRRSWSEDRGTLQEWEREVWQKATGNGAKLGSNLRFYGWISSSESLDGVVGRTEVLSGRFQRFLQNLDCTWWHLSLSQVVCWLCCALFGVVPRVRVKLSADRFHIPIPMLPTWRPVCCVWQFADIWR